MKNDITTQELIEKLYTSDIENLDISEIINLKSGLDRRLYIGEIDCDMSDSINTYIHFYNNWDEENNIDIKDRKPIVLIINSNGGDLVAAFSIIDTIRLSKTPVYTINIGAAYSSGFMIFIHGHHRIAYKNSSFLFHQGSAGTIGDAHKFQNFAQFYKVQLEILKNMVLESSNISEEVYNEHEKEDWWLTAQEALEYGLTDEVI